MSLHIATGPMMAGKTLWLIRHARSLRNAIVIKPLIDTRSARGYISAHNGERCGAIEIADIGELYNAAQGYDHILIDEAQFIPHLDKVVRLLLAQGKKIYISGLETDYKMRNFGSIPRLIHIADTVYRICGTCAACGDYAHYTARYSAEKETIVIGGADTYYAVCGRCHPQR